MRKPAPFLVVACDRPALDSPSRRQCPCTAADESGGHRLNAAADRNDQRSKPRPPLRDHVATSIRRYLGDLNGSGTENLYEIALRELEIPLFIEVLAHCEGNQSRAAAMLGIHRATLRKKLREYGLEQ
jgi:Fis family transcriptional regulator, factor for inversion stimulation protein